ncbi:MAG TPA: efflux RND transporter periplasmic adaptor subunit [Candidatus Hydrogenedentes bacterium]|nr:efflux RND transporter periplasmic adaptor subunit [Candidatus Hydrogenedentota bacterium]HPC18261.1 efflux RND transporter periplasmic adaptor subunit [Candidatus Hydrogenedentota bacterium]HRT20568.1 efflux RND transporter periplasmic adaptor subunit [Candidatus Hydrogenedentota bacterium]HRT65227.1 efflux RND transporter periplasmic adaptor subunit [Candidatus Hydrogenedentota bacterium]
MRHRVLIALVALAALGAGAVFVRSTLAGSESGALLFGLSAEKAELGMEKTPGPDSGEAKAPIAIVPVEIVEADNVLRITGTLTADEKAEVASTANGIVEEVYVERGSLVEKGAVLVKVDPTDVENGLREARAGIEELKAALGWDENRDSKGYNVENQPGVQMAKAALDLAAVNNDRITKLFEQGAVSKAQYDQSNTEYESARQRHQQALYQARQLYQSYKTACTKLKTLEKILDDTTIEAPFTGWVTQRYVSKGERVSTNPMGAGANVASMVKVDPLRLLLMVPQQDIAHVQPGGAVRFQVDSFPGRIFTGEVRYVSPSVENMTRSMSVEALVPNPDHVLRPGFFVTAELVLPEKRKDCFVPESAVVRENDVARVFVVRDGKALAQVVSTGETREGRVRIVTGLAEGDRVIAEPDKVKDGDAVQ